MEKLIILGGGPAGMAVAHFAQKNGWDFVLLEAGENVGGNGRTFRKGDFYFDAGAHRLHDKISWVTDEIKSLLKDELLHIQVPSQIYHQNNFIDFPLSPLDLLRKLGVWSFGKASLALMKEKIRGEKRMENFEEHALAAYGKDIADRFLLKYSEKLWGKPCTELSPMVSGKRLKGLNLTTFIIEGLKGKKAKTTHLDGSFYYPKWGFGAIFDKVAEVIPTGKIRTNARVTKLIAENNYIAAVEINGSEVLKADCVVNTLPLNLSLRLLSRPVPDHITEIASSIEFRHMVLVVLMLNKPSFTQNASVYFPDPDIPFTRIYEPKNRSPYLAPTDKTCIVVEIPCSQNDTIWKNEGKETLQIISTILAEKSLVKENEIIGHEVVKLPYAYPVLEINFREKSQKLIEYLQGYKNMLLTGQSAVFEYIHIHDLFLAGKEVVEEIKKKYYTV